MVTLSIETIGEERFVRGMNNYIELMKDFREPFEQIAQDFWRINERNFAAGGTPTAFRPAQNARYIAWKLKKVGHNKPMVLYGRLRDSLTGVHQADSQDTIRKIGKTSAEFGTRVPYARRHYYERNSKAVQLTEADKVRWGRIIQTWAYQKLKNEPGVSNVQ